MKKIAFTLTEILISITIIGVVSMLTMPSMITGYQNRANATALSKAYSTLTNIVSKAQTDSNAVTVGESKLFRGILCTPSADGSGNGCEDAYGNKSKLKQIIPQYLNVIKTCEGSDCDDIKYDISTQITSGKLVTSGTKKSISEDPSLFGQSVIGFYTNDQMIYYFAPVSKAYYVAIDVNSDREPNIKGRDLFTMFLCNDGRIIAGGASDGVCDDKTANPYLGEPFNYLRENNWNMDY